MGNGYGSQGLFCFVDPYECIMSPVRRAGQLVALHGKNCNVGHHMQTFPPNFLIPAMLIDTIDFCHSIPLSPTLTLPGGHKVSLK